MKLRKPLLDEFSFGRTWEDSGPFTTWRVFWPTGCRLTSGSGSTIPLASTSTKMYSNGRGSISSLRWEYVYHLLAHTCPHVE